MKRTITFRITLAIVTTTAALAVTAGSANAFEPPADPTDNFTCEGGPVAGHPGHNGLGTAMTHASSPTAWNAAFNPGPVGNCS
jgi:hypothetical protein